MKLSSIRLIATNVSELAQFYQTVIGVSGDGDNADYVEFENAGATLALCSQRAVDTYNKGATLPAANRSVILEFQVDDVDAERSRLDAIVKDWVLEPTTQPWGNRSMIFRDPDGNLINFYMPIRRNE